MRGHKMSSRIGNLRLRYMNSSLLTTQKTTTDGCKVHHYLNNIRRYCVFVRERKRERDGSRKERVTETANV